MANKPYSPGKRNFAYISPPTSAGSFYTRSTFMRWTPGGLSSDVEDRRGDSGGGFGGGGLGIVGFLILLVVSLVTGRNYIGAYLSGGGGQTVQRSAPSPQEDRSAQFASFVLGDAQNTWT